MLARHVGWNRQTAEIHLDTRTEVPFIFKGLFLFPKRDIMEPEMEESLGEREIGVEFEEGGEHGFFGFLSQRNSVKTG